MIYQWTDLRGGGMPTRTGILLSVEGCPKKGKGADHHGNRGIQGCFNEQGQTVLTLTADDGTISWVKQVAE